MRVELRTRKIAIVFAALFIELAPALRAQDDDATLVDDRGARTSAVQRVPPRDHGYGVIDDRDRLGLIDERHALAVQGIDLQHRLSEVRISEAPDGVAVTVETDHGDAQFTPDEYVRAVLAAQETQKSNGVLYRWFNITRPWGFVWVGAGFLAQALFTYRMILQWWASEKHKRSIVPVGYWWGSLFGGMLLFAYFIWRKDIVGYLGQSTGVFIYARNLALIYRGRRIEAEGARPLAPDDPPPGAAA
jgi:lipid-A-disaccharide synthase-like uncharacterized protein